jgi:hypothetical protein
MGGARLVFDVDVCAGNEHSSKHCAPGLWALLDRIPRDQWPVLLRGDAGFGNEPIMREAEQRRVAYLFKLRLTANVKRMIAKLSTQSTWINAGQGFEAKEATVRLEGWSRQRRAIVMRRRLRGDLAVSAADDHAQQKLSFVEIGADADVYEYCVLATSLEEDLSVFGQVYRDRGDAENIFDELKNQWGWGGFTTHDLARCHLAARLVALFYNWWNIARLAEPDRHMEAITSRPLLLHAIATRVRHARQTTITIASSHAKSVPVAKALHSVASFLRDLTKNAEQLTSLQQWRAILSKAFEVFLNGRQLRLPPRLAQVDATKGRKTSPEERRPIFNFNCGF